MGVVSRRIALLSVVDVAIIATPKVTTSRGSYPRLVTYLHTLSTNTATILISVAAITAGLPSLRRYLQSSKSVTVRSLRVIRLLHLLLTQQL